VKVDTSLLLSQTDVSGYSLMLSQLLKMNGASKVVIAANKGIKMDIAKDIEAGDVYVELDR
jgi:D-arabinitol dehydrogenase (NADP+)